jgi:hypothetical protein
MTLDGSASAYNLSGSSIYVSGFSTANSGDIIILHYGGSDSSSQATISSLADTAGLSWTSIAGVNLSPTGCLVRVEVWYAIANTPLTNDKVTATLSKSPSDQSIMDVFGILGNPQAVIPNASASSLSSGVITLQLSSFNNDFVVGLTLYSGTQFSGATVTGNPATVIATDSGQNTGVHFADFYSAQQPLLNASIVASFASGATTFAEVYALGIDWNAYLAGSFTMS